MLSQSRGLKMLSLTPPAYQTSCIRWLLYLFLCRKRLSPLEDHCVTSVQLPQFDAIASRQTIPSGDG
jgi:hypothetical protein